MLSLFRVLLPQFIVRWLPIVTALTIGLGLALGAVRAAEAIGISSTVAAIVATFVFALIMLSAEAFEDLIVQRLTKTQSFEEFSLKLRAKHRVNLSIKANIYILCVGHILFATFVAYAMLVLLGKCNC